MQYQALCIISSSHVNLNWSYGPEMTKLGVDLCDLDLWPLTLTFGMDITSVIGNNWEHCQKGVTDRQTDSIPPEGYELWHPYNWPGMTTNHLPPHLANYLRHHRVSVFV